MLAIGGNALAPSGTNDPAAQVEKAHEVAASAIGMLADGHRMLLVHGNGPQVGALALAQEAVAREVPPQPLYVLGAMTQGQLGYLLAQALGDALAALGREREVAAVMTQVVVDADDPAFSRPTKPIGPFFSAGRARRLAEARGWSVAEDAGRGWRRVVASPEPLEVVEWPQIRELLAAGNVVVACGGGGVPVTRRGEELVGVEAVIDKDLSAAWWPRWWGRTSLLLLTGVERVALDFGTPRRAACSTRSRSTRRGRTWPTASSRPGSMGPKVEAAIRSSRAAGARAVITSLERAADALAGRAGTRIVA